MKTMTFLVNPRGTRRRASGRGTQRRTKRRPPKGWASWKAYMASIRPNSKQASASSSGSTSMARKRSKKRHTRRGRHTTRRRAATRTNPPTHARHRRRHVRRNPIGVRSIGGKLRALPSFALHTAINAGVAIGGKIVARKVRGLAKQQAGSVVGSLIEAGVGLVGGALLSTVAPEAGAMFALGGVMAPMETAIQQLKIPHVSDSLGDDGYLIGGDSGVTLVSAFPEDYADASIGRYANPARRLQLQSVSATNAQHESKYAA